MKTKLIALLSVLAAASLLRAANVPVPACCAPAPAAKPPCCAEEKPSAPLTARSIYQLDATWTNDAGREVRLASFRGRPVIVAMVFTSCEYACPTLVNDLKRLRAELPEAVREKAQIVLVSFDTVRDTPAALRTFRERMSLDDRWTLLRGDAGAVQELAMVLGVKFKQDARGQFAHSNLLTVLNLEGEIAHQHAGLNGDISEATKAVTLVAK